MAKVPVADHHEPLPRVTAIGFHDDIGFGYCLEEAGGGGS